MKTFKVDMELKKKMNKEQIMKHPKWKKRLWVIVTLVLAAIGFTIYSILPLELFDKIAFGTIMLVVSLIPAYFYMIFLHATCADAIPRRLDDIIAIKDYSISHMYREINDNIPTRYVQEEVNYDSIKRIVYNKYHNRIDIFGQRYYTYCNDLRNPKWKKSTLGDPNPYKSRFYLFYENNDEILEILKEKTGLEFEVINYPEV